MYPLTVACRTTIRGRRGVRTPACRADTRVVASARRLPSGNLAIPKSTSPRTFVHVTTRSSWFSFSIQFSMRGDALIKSLIAFVSSRYVTRLAAYRRLPGRALAAVRRQPRHRDHPRPQSLDEAVLEALARLLEEKWHCPGESAGAPKPLAPQFSSAPQQSLPSHPQGHLGSRSSSNPFSQHQSGVLHWQSAGLFYRCPAYTYPENAQ
jgi:hypothetical protein